MAKALFGYTAGTHDPRLVAELRSLRMRLATLEHELERSRTENAVLAAALEVVDTESAAVAAVSVRDLREPALT